MGINSISLFQLDINSLAKHFDNRSTLLKQLGDEFKIIANAGHVMRHSIKGT